MAHTLYNVDKKIARIRTAEYLYHDKLFSNLAIPIDFVITPEVIKLVTKTSGVITKSIGIARLENNLS
jgi:hypothetical protein